MGITNTPDVRLKKHLPKGWKLIGPRGPMDGQLTRGWEASILQMLRAHGAHLAPTEAAGHFDGYTEAWIASSYPVRTLAELMNQVQANETS